MNGNRAGEREQYLRPGRYIDSDAAQIIAFARKHASEGTQKEKAIRLFYAVRDGYWYNPYGISLQEDAFTASICVGKKDGFCISKAIILVAALRAVGIPARLGLCDIKNHLTTARLLAAMGTDVFYFHGYAELFLDGRWFKVTPTFNKELCERAGVFPLEFDGTCDCMFHPFDRDGNRHMEYVGFHGVFADLPFEKVVAGYRAHYPLLFVTQGGGLQGDFQAELEQEREN